MNRSTSTKSTSRNARAKSAGIEAADVSAAARTVWLAGLGVASLAAKEGEKLVGKLVDEGQLLQARGTKMRASVVRDLNRSVDSAKRQLGQLVEPVTVQVSRVTRDLEQGLGGRVTDLLSRVGVPNKRDVEELTGRVGTLTRKVKASGQRATGAIKTNVKRAAKRA